MTGVPTECPPLGTFEPGGWDGAVSGSVVVEKPDTVPDMGSNVAATFDVTFASGDHVTGSFSALSCSFSPDDYSRYCGCIADGKACDLDEECCSYTGFGGDAGTTCAPSAMATGAYGYCTPH
jgi:hypothetical protein